MKIEGIRRIKINARVVRVVTKRKKGILIKEEVGFQPKPVKGEEKKDGKDKKEKK